MIIDKKLSFGDAQAVTVTAASTDAVDMGQTNPNLGAGTPVYLVVEVTEAFTATGAATLQIDLEDSADDSTYAVIASAGVVAKATLVAGYKWVIAVPVKTRRYMRMNYTVATGPMTAGKISAYLTLNPDTE